MEIEPTVEGNIGATSATSGTRTRRKRSSRVAQIDLDDSGQYKDGDAPSNSAQTKKARKSGPAKVRGKKGALANITLIPMDIFVEIVSHLEPLDLLNLGRTSKFLRSVLMTRQSRYMWTNAFGNLNPPPPPVESINEPSYAALLFEPYCSVVGCERRVRNPNFATMRRLCATHSSEFYMKSRIASSALTRWGIWHNRSWSLLHHNMGTGEVVVSDFQGLIDVLKNEIGDPSKDNIDEEKVDQFVERRSSQVRSEKQKTAEMEAWVDSRKTEAYNGRKDRAAARAASIQKKLRELGWEFSETKDSSFAIEAEEYHSILYQPRLLSDSIWKRIRPRLESILVKRKARRLEEERMSRQQDRIRDLQKELSSLARRTIPNADQATIIDRVHWECTFPCDQREILRVPSLSAFATNDDGISISEVFKAQESQIMEDVRIFQMQTRSALVSLLRRVEAVVNGATVDRAGTIFPNLWGEPDVATLRNEDHANLEALKRPTALFLISTDPLSSCMTYPFPIRENPTIDITLKRMSKIHKVAVGLLKDLGLEEASMEHMEGVGNVFCCECCPVGIPRLYSWKSLLDHYEKEMSYYEEEKKKRTYDALCQQIFEMFEPKAWINTHENPRVSMPDLECYRNSLVTADPDDDLYTCLYCPIYTPHELVSVAGSEMSLHIAHLHLRERHGLSNEDWKNDLVRQTGSQMFPSFGLDDPYDSDAYGLYDSDAFGFYDSDAFGLYDSDSFDSWF